MSRRSPQKSSFRVMTRECSADRMATSHTTSVTRMGSGDTTREKVLGIGGFFFRAKDPKALAAWYETQLGINQIPMTEGAEAWTQQEGPTAFAPFKADTKYFGNPSQQWMINFR